MNKEVQPIEPAFRDLADAKDLTSVKAVRDRAVAIEAYAKEARDPELINHAVEVRLKAERKAGQLLADTPNATPGPKPKLRSATEHNSPSLDDLGVTRKQSYLWQALAALDEPTFLERLTVAQRAAAAAIEQTKEERTAAKKERRAEREVDLATKITALPSKRYGAILADPAWRFKTYSDDGLDRAADNHYPTSSLEEIKALDVLSVAANDCVLFLWATVPMLLEAVEVMAKWGFAYKSHVAWVKEREGTGFWFRNTHELLLVGTRGHVPAPAPGTQWASVVQADVGKHSVKPDEFYELIEFYFPNLPRIELNARAARTGWDAWGNEAPRKDNALNGESQR